MILEGILFVHQVPLIVVYCVSIFNIKSTGHLNTKSSTSSFYSIFYSIYRAEHVLRRTGLYSFQGDKHNLAMLIKIFVSV